MKNKWKDVEVKFGKNAFAPKTSYCDVDGSKMRLSKKDFFIAADIKASYKIFICPKCKKEYFGLDQASRYESFLALRKQLNGDISRFQRKISFDGDNYILRIPKHLAKGKLKEATITPITEREFLVSI